MYYEGIGVKKDSEKGFEYTKKAANAGDLQSQFNLGNAFRKGNFVKQDYTKAAFWYGKSAKTGYSFSQNEYGLLFAQGLGVEQDYYKAYAWISVSAETENDQAIKNLKNFSQIFNIQEMKKAKELADQYKTLYLK